MMQRHQLSLLASPFYKTPQSEPYASSLKTSPNPSYLPNNTRQRNFTGEFRDEPYSKCSTSSGPKTGK